MSLSKESFTSLEKYYEIRESSDHLYEYIDGSIFMSPSPSTKHQRISGRLLVKISNYLTQKNDNCEVLAAPYDIELSKEGMEGTKIVIPDLAVMCDKSGFTDTKYVGVPDMIVEILSPSNQSHDLITKLNLYMKYGVKEYWIVNPMLNSITIYSLNKEGVYEQHAIKTDLGTITSKLLNGFHLELEHIFQ
ncbi:Uma2 family endonuclease [Sutcliffiella horikoshii]|uniref:Uma2 family endonuclease n=1 Tax=Sutcliffiella horikoshii TaxID=79883 RepID=A0AA95B5S7_9BACI|nr:Uma2 family endonuclease [Sutcliffiella horikoshii]TYS58600.1 Uma2 family endonuclease [Sutcliffiella horikoshii]